VPSQVATPFAIAGQATHDPPEVAVAVLVTHDPEQT
jgi:hypothetical protein